MESLTVGSEMRERLRRAAELLEIRDDAGEILGFFAPVTLDKADQYAAAAAHFRSKRDAELPEAVLPKVVLPKKADSHKMYSLREVYEHLLSISPDEERRSILRKRLAEMARDEQCSAQ